MLHDYQTLIAGVLVLLGVIFTLRANAWITRNDRHETLKLEQQAIRTALIEELKIVKMSLVDNVEKIKKHKNGGWILVPRGTMSDMYKTLLPRIGLLTSIQVEKVLFAYMSAIQFHEQLTLLPGAIIEEHYVSFPLPQATFDTVVKGLRILIPHIDEAILSLSEPDIAGTK